MDLVHKEFRDGVLPKEATWQAVFLIPKGGGDYHGIGLVELVWKAIAVILNHHFTSSITYHDSLCGFQAGRGTGTTTLKVKLLRRVTTMREEVLHVISLDLHKAYDSLDRSRCLEVLQRYDVGTRGGHLLRR